MAVAVFMASQHGEPAILVPNANELTYLSNGQRMLLEDAPLGTPTFLLSSAGRPVLLQLRPCGRLVDTGPRGVGRIAGSFPLRMASSPTRSYERILLACYPAFRATQLVRQAPTNVAQYL